MDKVRYEISPDGNTVVFLSGFDDLYSVPIDGGTPVLLHDAVSGHIIYPAITPNSSGVVFLDYYYNAP